MSLPLNDPLMQPKYQSYDLIFKVLLNISLSSVLNGYFLAYFNTITFSDTISILAITQDTALMQGLLSFCIPAGAGLGGYLSRYVNSRFSRLQSNLLVAYVAVAATILLQTKSLPLILLARFVQGVVIGLSTVLRSMYIKEFSPIQMAAKFGSLNQAMFTAGLVYTFAQTYLLSLVGTATVYWRIVYFFPVLISGWQIYNFKFNYPFETPKYLLENHRAQEARQLVALIYKPQYVEERLHELQKAISMAHQQTLQLQQPAQGSFPKLPPKPELKSNKMAVLAAYHVSMMQQFTGIQIIIIYTGDIVLKIWPFLQKTLPIMIHTLGFLASYQTMKALDIYGRKQLLQKGLAVLATLSFVFFFCFIWKQHTEGTSPHIELLPSLIIILGFILFRMTFSLTIGPITWLYLPEIVQSDVIGKATMSNWLVAALVSFLFPVMVKFLGGPQYIFVILGIIMTVGYIINQKLMVQTKDKTQWQIRQQYDQMLTKY